MNPEAAAQPDFRFASEPKKPPKAAVDAAVGIIVANAEVVSHQDGKVSGSRIVRRLASASVERAWRGSGSIFGGKHNPISIQIASTMPCACASTILLGSYGATKRSSQAYTLPRWQSRAPITAARLCLHHQPDG